MTYLIEKSAATKIKERPLITIEFAPDIHPDEIDYSYPHPLFVFGDFVTTTEAYPVNKYKVCALELIESKTTSGRLLNQPYWKYKINNGERSYWKEESALVRWSERKTIHSGLNNHNQQFQSLSIKTIVEQDNLTVSSYKIGAIVKVIDPNEHHTEWANFEILKCHYSLESVDWSYFLLPLDSSAVFDEPLWVKEDEICPVESASNIDVSEFM